MTDDRQAVLDGARYLRRVRPIDPDEVSGYVEGGMHPAVARRILREAAFELGLGETADGRFVPVPDEPFEGRVGPVDRLPAAYVRRVEDLLVERYGPDWHRGDSGDRLRERIRRLKDDYYRGREVEYDDDAALGYAVYHLADFYAAAGYVLDELATDGLLSRRLRVLDVGAGVGGPALGLHDLLFGPPGGDHSDGVDTGDAHDDAEEGDGSATPPALVDYHAIEPSPAADVLDALLDETDRNFHASTHRTTAEAFDPRAPLDGDGSHGGNVGSAGEVNGEDGDAEDDEEADPAGYDLILFANVLNELDDPEGVVRRYLDALAPDGSLVALAPADRETSIGLRRVERAVTDRATVYSPTVRLWPGAEPTDTGWSFEERPPIEAPPFQRKLHEGAADAHTAEFLKREVRFSYSILRPDGRRRFSFDPDPDRFARMADADSCVTDRIDLVAVKLSRSLSDGGNPLFRVGDGSQREDHYAVLVNETSLNRELLTAEYGDLLVIEGALALWNDDEGGYNLVVDEETVVDRVPAGR